MTDNLSYDNSYWELLKAELRRCIPQVLTDEDNLELQKVPNAEEIKKAVFSLNPDSASGPDGFNGHFFQTTWEIIQVDVIAAVHQFYAGAELPRSCTASLICLIPKIQNPTTFADYRPISLSNFFNKVISKIMAIRVEGILPKIISPNQCGFVKGRQISDNILLEEELMCSINKKSQGC